MFERILNILLVLSLGLLLGAVIFFGLGVAGVLFNPDLLASRTVSGSLNARVLERLMVLMTSGSVIALGSSVPLMFSKPRRTNVPAFVALILLAGLSLYLSLVLFPEIDQIRVAIGSFDPVLAAKQDLHAQFTDVHGRFSTLAKVGFGLGLIALISHLLSLVTRARRSEPGVPGGGSLSAEGADADRRSTTRVIPGDGERVIGRAAEREEEVAGGPSGTDGEPPRRG